MAKAYAPTIGLEIHAELSTRTKMFCACLNDPSEKRPNRNICPICMAHPGTLPTMNKEAVHKVLKVGTALGAELPDDTWFDRKNYFYPDIPKGYQISQYEDPLVRGGSLAGIAITRVHLEEDTARSSHITAGGKDPERRVEDPERKAEGGRSLIDFNRAGVALMELVTEPVIHDAEMAGHFARELQLLLRAVGASEANMEQGQMRVEANISVSSNPEKLGTKVEVKNLNSFRSVERAIAYEVERQIAHIESGGEVVQETRGWDENKQITFSQRKKESSHDYRYFPEPDLPRLRLSEVPEFSSSALQGELPELPEARRKRYIELSLKSEDADMFVREPMIGSFFDSVYRTQPDVAELAANYISSDVAGKFQAGDFPSAWFEGAGNAARFAQLMRMIQAARLSSRGAKDILAAMFDDARDPEIIADEKGLLQQNDTGALEAIAQKVIEANVSVVGEYRAGKTTVLQFLVGQGMKESKGSANPQELIKAFEKLLF